MRIAPSPQAPSHRIRWFLALAPLLALAPSLCLTACHRPCDKLMDKLERCTRAAPNRALYDAPGVRERIQTRCRRAASNRVKACLAQSDCRKFLDCAAEAVQTPRDRF